ncbi:TPM domain-containing protein [Synoicihabitans lomoniglobus]|uniref:TPM domain-containing protein n=1 Tax=Synoicihabitans lomoniglobus TaxID=2909285 RepID=A0AAE9ZXM7_9BACT|nr:TPM domain-containing protein [Opitutaceae bacterium LMO-M01]
MPKRSLLIRFLLLFTLIGGLAATAVAETIPSAPRAYFNDYTGRISAPTGRQLNAQLEAYERESSNQLLVAIYPTMDSDSSVFDYTQRVAESWKVGQADRNNGAVLFIFLNDRQAYLQVGYGLEGALPDATAKRIISDELAPSFRRGDLDGGLSAAVGAMIAATKGEYVGSGRTAGDGRGRTSGRTTGAGGFILILIIVALRMFFGGRRVIIGGRGHHRSTGMWIGGGGGGGFGGGGGGGGFSGGGGSFGGGGAGGSW